MYKKILALGLISMFWVAAYAATVPLRVDPNHSNVSFSLPILGGVSHVTGKFGSFSAELNYDKQDITKSSVVAKIKTDSISTGIGARDNHLKTADFFDAAKYPEITFTSKKVEKKGGKYLLTGDFSMHGVTKEISFPFTVVGNCADKKAAEVAGPCGFKASLQINRKDYGLTWNQVLETGGVLVGEKIEIEIDVEAVKDKAAA